MDRMQNRTLISPMCNCKQCKNDKPLITPGEGRTIDKAATKAELRLEEACLIDNHDHDFDEDPEWFDYEAPYRTETPA